MRGKRLFSMLLILAGLALLTLAGCNEETKKKEEEPKTSESTLPAQIIGRGYDVTGRYANSTEVKPPVLDFDRMSRDGLIQQDPNIKEGDFRTVSGSTASEYTRSLAKKQGITAHVGFAGFGSFQSELSKNYDEERYSKDSYSFATISSNIAKDAYYASNMKRLETLPGYASEAFLADLKTKSPDEIIRLYGTHVMLGGIWGARLDHHFSAKKKASAYSQNTGTSFSTKAEASFKGITVGGGTESSTDTGYKENFDSSTEEKHTKVYGGKPEYGQGIHNNQEYKDWIESIDGRLVWMDYYPDSLVPIYEVVDDAFKKDALERAYVDYITGKQIIMVSALKSGVLTEPFDLQGGEKKYGGDGDINSQDGRQTRWSLGVILTQEDAGVRASFDYWLKEMASNYSELNMKKSVLLRVPAGKDFIISEPLLEWDSGHQYVKGKHHEQMKVSDTSSSLKGPDFLPLDDLYITIDGNTSRDQDIMRVRGTLKVKYSYVE